MAHHGGRSTLSKHLRQSALGMVWLGTHYNNNLEQKTRKSKYKDDRKIIVGVLDFSYLYLLLVGMRYIEDSKISSAKCWKMCGRYLPCTNRFAIHT